MEISFIIIAIIAILILASFWLIAPGKKREIPVAKSYAHRGLHYGQIPENSLAAFKEAAKQGYGVEFDVHLTKDKQLVVFHDDTLLRMTGEDIPISNLTYAELSEYRLKNTDEKIPLLQEVFEALGDVPILCEIKKQLRNTNIEICLYVANALDTYPGDICIESFNPFVLKWFKKNRPEFARGQLSADFLKDRGDLDIVSAFFASNLLLNFLSRPDFIAYRFTDTSFGYRFCKNTFETTSLGWTPKGEKARELCMSKFDGEVFELS